MVDHAAPLVPAEQERDTPLVVPERSQLGRPDRIRLSECREAHPAFLTMVDDAAAAAGVSPRALFVRALLHLPRVVAPGGSVGTSQVKRELFHNARRLRADVNTVRDVARVDGLRVQDLRFERIVPDRADAIFSSLHYLRSAREGSLNFALVDPLDGLPVSLCSVSPLEWKRVRNRLSTQFRVAPERIWDVSRTFSIDGAPRNASSFLLARVRSELSRSGLSIDLLATAVDPNLGFTGSSYRAANWRQWLTVEARPYLYDTCRYISPRQLRREYGTADLVTLRKTFPHKRFEQSRTTLLDSLILCCRIKGETEAVPPQEQSRLRR